MLEWLFENTLAPMKQPTPDDISLIETVKAHLKLLSTNYQYNADVATIRVASNSLRILLVQNLLAQAWRASGLNGPMTFRTWCITSTQSDSVIAYCGGGDVLPGLPFSMCLNAELAERTLDLKDFCQQPRIQVDNVKVTTVELINFVANTLGGAHFDPQGKSPKSRKPVFDLLRGLESGEIEDLPIEVNGRSLLHHEMLSIAQVVVRSRKVMRLSAWPVPGG